jgi:hypothetical protein
MVTFPEDEKGNTEYRHPSHGSIGVGMNCKMIVFYLRYLKQ